MFPIALWELGFGGFWGCRFIEAKFVGWYIFTRNQPIWDKSQISQKFTPKLRPPMTQTNFFGGIYVFLAIEFDSTIRNLIRLQKSGKISILAPKMKTLHFSGTFSPNSTPHIPTQGRNFGPKNFPMLNGCQRYPQRQKISWYTERSSVQALKTSKTPKNRVYLRIFFI